MSDRRYMEAIAREFRKKHRAPRADDATFIQAVSVFFELVRKKTEIEKAGV